MAYTPTEWASGDVVTSQKLNKLEQGVAGAGFSVVEFEFDTTNTKYVSVRTTESILAELQATVPQVWLFKGIEDTGWPIEHDSWALIFGFENNDNAGNANISATTNLGIIAISTPDLSGEHVVVSLYD